MESKEKFDISEMEKFLEKYELGRLRSRFVDRIVILIIAALGLIAALAWDEALRHAFEKIFSILGGGSTLLEEFLYALIVTAAAVFVSMYLGKLFKKRRKK